MILSIQAGLEAAKKEVLGNLQFLVNGWVILFAAVAILITAIFNIVKLTKHRNNGEDYQTNITALIICVAALVLVISFPSWGWTMIGVTPTATGA